MALQRSVRAKLARHLRLSSPPTPAPAASPSNRPPPPWSSRHGNRAVTSHPAVTFSTLTCAAAKFSERASCWDDTAQRAEGLTAKACSDEACSSMPCTVSLSIALPPSMIEVTICPSLLRRVPLPLQSKVCSPPPPAAATREIATPPTALARTSSQCDGSSEPELKLSCVHTETGSVLAVACRCEKDHGVWCVMGGDGGKRRCSGP